MEKQVIAEQIPKFEWIEEEEEDENQRTRHSFWGRLIYKTKTDPLIPMGMLATCCALGFGLRQFYLGDSMRQQHMMRARVMFQAFTIGIFALSTAGLTQINKSKKVEEKEVKNKATEK